MECFSSRFARRNRRRGTILYFISGGLVMLLGAGALAVDYGVLINDKNHLQRVCDAAALAGATKLPDANAALSTARLVTAQNNFIENAANQATYTILNNNTQLRVEAVRQRPLFFARVFGQTDGTVRARATAGVAGNTPNIAPIGITTTSYNAENQPLNASGTQRLYDNQPSPVFTTKLIDHKKEAFGAGEFILFDLRGPNGKSPSHMERQLAGQESVNITPADVIGAVTPPEATTLNAKSQDDFLFSGMATRFAAAAGAPWLDIDPTQGTNYVNYVGQHYTQVFNRTEPIGNGQPFFQNPRVLTLIVTPPTATNTNGTLNALVVDLATVYVERLYRNSGVTYMDYRYLPGTIGGSGSGTLLN
jgi:Flp pilus assembly protein TadG